MATNQVPDFLMTLMGIPPRPQQPPIPGNHDDMFADFAVNQPQGTILANIAATSSDTAAAASITPLTGPVQRPHGAFWQQAVQVNIEATDPLTTTAALPLAACHISARLKSASPTLEEMVNWTCIKDVSAWAGFKDRDAINLASLLAKLEVDPEDPIDDLAQVDPGDFNNDLSNWLIDGTPASSGAKGKARALMHAARVNKGLDEPKALTAFKAENDKRKFQEIEWYKSQPKETKIIRQDVPAVQPADTGDDRYINIRDIADDLRNQEIPLIPDEDHPKLLANWRDNRKSTRDPPEEHEPTMSQLSYLAHCKKHNTNPFVNFGFWGPFGDRMMQRMITVMWMLMPDGVTRCRNKFLGPPTVQQWLSCWMVFQTGMEMFEMASREALDDYAAFIQDLVVTYGPHCWAIIYQAEARMRRTGLDMIRRGAHYLLEEAVNAEQTRQTIYIQANPYKFNPKQPWDYCFRMAIDFMSAHATKYWDKYVKEPCRKINAENARVDQFLQDDCQIAATPEEHMATGGLLVNSITPAQQHILTSDIAYGPRPVTKQPKIKTVQEILNVTGPKKALSQQDGNGKWTKNNKGVKLCGPFQAGQCPGGSAQCPRSEAHQCNKCLQNSHGASTCGTVKPKEDKVGKGKGRGGKGKKHGKKHGRG